MPGIDEPQSKANCQATTSSHDVHPHHSFIFIIIIVIVGLSKRLRRCESLYTQQSGPRVWHWLTLELLLYAPSTMNDGAWLWILMWEIGAWVGSGMIDASEGDAFPLLS